MEKNSSELVWHSIIKNRPVSTLLLNGPQILDKPSRGNPLLDIKCNAEQPSLHSRGGFLIQLCIDAFNENVHKSWPRV